MGKLLKIFLTLILSASLVACGSNDSSSDSTSSDVSSSSDSDTSNEVAELQVADYEYTIVDGVIYYWVAVKNTSKSQTFAFPYLTVSYYDTNGDVVNTKDARMAWGVGANDTIYYINKLNYFEGFDHLEFAVGAESDNTSSKFVDDAYPLTTEFEVSSYVENDSIICTITNNSSFTINGYYLSVMFTKDGELVYTYFYGPNNYDHEFEYEISISDIPEFDDYEIHCQANKVASDD